MGAGHYSSPGGGGWGVGVGGFWFFHDKLDLITPIRLCNILTTLPPPSTAPHAAPHTHPLALDLSYSSSAPFDQPKRAMV